METVWIETNKKMCYSVIDRELVAKARKKRLCSDANENDKDISHEFGRLNYKTCDLDCL